MRERSESKRSEPNTKTNITLFSCGDADDISAANCFDDSDCEAGVTCESWVTIMGPVHFHSSGYNLGLKTQLRQQIVEAGADSLSSFLTGPSDHFKCPASCTNSDEFASCGSCTSRYPAEWPWSPGEWLATTWDDACGIGVRACFQLRNVTCNSQFAPFEALPKERCSGTARPVASLACDGTSYDATKDLCILDSDDNSQTLVIVLVALFIVGAIGSYLTFVQRKKEKIEIKYLESALKAKELSPEQVSDPSAERGGG